LRDNEAVVYDNTVYCVACLPEGISVDDERVAPILADQEWEYAPVCKLCGETHDYMRILNEDEEAGDDLCDYCFTSGVHVERTYKGKTVGVECGCDAIVGEDDEEEKN
jgi:hypothetical protein